jgi:hypothetical protein
MWRKVSDKMAQSIGLVPEMIDGRRITDAPMLWRYDLCWANK